jgi:hypothetical protein
VAQDEESSCARNQEVENREIGNDAIENEQRNAKKEEQEFSGE